MKDAFAASARTTLSRKDSIQAVPLCRLLLQNDVCGAFSVKLNVTVERPDPGT
ncbi:MAG TPA: hypothetical protein VHX61_09395 [Rhizomicrobium sp.]|nr:hypothetical protein [Rhizomicrobium sp.]